MSKMAVAAIAHALYDMDSTGRLSEDPNAQPEYFKQAERFLYMVRSYRPKRERVAIARAIRK
jgi:hypothetical protein